MILRFQYCNITFQVNFNQYELNWTWTQLSSNMKFAVIDFLTTLNDSIKAYNFSLSTHLVASINSIYLVVSMGNFDFDMVYCLKSRIMDSHYETFILVLTHWTVQVSSIHAWTPEELVCWPTLLFEVIIY